MEPSSAPPGEVNVRLRPLVFIRFSLLWAYYGPSEKKPRHDTPSGRYGATKIDQARFAAFAEVEIR